MAATASTPHVPPARPATIRNILFATDFSPCSEAALPLALALAKRYDAALFPTHVLPPEPHYELPLEPEPVAMNIRKQEARSKFDALLASGVLNGVIHEPILRCGELWETIQDVISSRAIDLIVCGTHGRQGLQKLMLGSVAEKIFRLAACPVLTAGPHAKLHAGDIGHILYATDFTTQSLAAFPYAYSLAERECARLTLVHVVQPAPPAIDAVILPSVDAEIAADAEKQLRELVDTYPALPVPPEVLVVNGPVKMILEVAAQRNTAIIVMGVRHKAAIATHFPWSVADAIVCNATCPVLTVRGS